MHTRCIYSPIIFIGSMSNCAVGSSDENWAAISPYPPTGNTQYHERHLTLKRRKRQNKRRYRIGHLESPLGYHHQAVHGQMRQHRSKYTTKQNAKQENSTVVASDERRDTQI